MDLTVEKQLLNDGSLTFEEVACLVAIAMEYHGLEPTIAQSEDELQALIEKLESTATAETAGESTTRP
jgi:hypothetical protein